MNYKQKKLIEFDNKLDEIQGKEITLGSGEFPKISLECGKDPEWIVGVQEGFIFCQNEAKKIISQTIDEILSCLPEKKCLHEIEKSSQVCVRCQVCVGCDKYFRDYDELKRDVYKNIGFNECRRRFLDNLDNLISRK